MPKSQRIIGYLQLGVEAMVLSTNEIVYMIGRSCRNESKSPNGGDVGIADVDEGDLCGKEL